MNDRQRKRDERAGRVIAYIDAKAEEFPEDSKEGRLAAQLRERRARVAELELARENSTSTRRKGTGGREDARAALRPMVKKTWDTYKTIILDRSDIKGLFKSPSRIKNDHDLITTARAYADAAASLAGLFAEYKLTAAFFNEMRAQADKLEAQTALQDTGNATTPEQTTGIEETLREADGLVERLHTLITNTYSDNPAKLAAWESASRLERAPRRKPRDDDEPPQPPPANG